MADNFLTKTRRQEEQTTKQLLEEKINYTLMVRIHILFTDK
jgi:hypothetical protein